MQTVLDGKYQAQSSVVALGMFDGVHIGHQVLLQKAKALAAQHGVPLVVCTFVQHPLTLIAPEKAPAMLTTLDERAAQMEALGVDVLYAQPFTKRIMTMPPEDYVGQLVRHFHPVAVVCGYNHTFGQGGKGTPALLSALGAALGWNPALPGGMGFAMGLAGCILLDRRTAKRKKGYFRIVAFAGPSETGPERERENEN